MYQSSKSAPMSACEVIFRRVVSGWLCRLVIAVTRPLRHVRPCGGVPDLSTCSNGTAQRFPQSNSTNGKKILVGQSDWQHEKMAGRHSNWRYINLFQWHALGRNSLIFLEILRSCSTLFEPLLLQAQSRVGMTLPSAENRAGAKSLDCLLGCVASTVAVHSHAPQKESVQVGGN